MTYEVTLVCGVTDALCAAATQTCTAEGPGSLRFNVLQSTDGGGNWRLVPPSVCLGPGDIISVAQLLADAEAAVKRLDLGAPHIAVNPPAATYVNIPTIFHATVQGPRAVALTVDGTAVALQVAPRWTWDFGDGASLDSDSPGIGYDDTSPTADPGHYPVLHTYTDNGTLRIGLTVTWNGTYTITGVAGTFPAPTKTYNDARALPIHQATATITGNG